MVHKPVEISLPIALYFVQTVYANHLEQRKAFRAPDSTLR